MTADPHMDGVMALLGEIGVATGDYAPKVADLTALIRSYGHTYDAGSKLLAAATETERPEILLGLGRALVFAPATGKPLYLHISDADDDTAITLLSLALVSIATTYPELAADAVHLLQQRNEKPGGFFWFKDDLSEATEIFIRLPALAKACPAMAEEIEDFRQQITTKYGLDQDAQAKPPPR